MFWWVLGPWSRCQTGIKTHTPPYTVDFFPGEASAACSQLLTHSWAVANQFSAIIAISVWLLNGAQEVNAKRPHILWLWPRGSQILGALRGSDAWTPTPNQILWGWMLGCSSSSWRGAEYATSKHGTLAKGSFWAKVTREIAGARRASHPTPISSWKHERVKDVLPIPGRKKHSYQKRWGSRWREFCINRPCQNNYRLLMFSWK